MALTTDPGYQLTYTVYQEAWYAQPGQRPELVVTKATKEGGCAWEFTIEDYTEKLNHPAIRVQIFDDAWQAFAEIPELFAELARNGRSTLADVQGILDGLGFVDATERTEEVR